MVQLRELREKDAILMLEWMHDKDIQAVFKRNMIDTTIEDARKFCVDSKIPNQIKNGDSLHFAIVDEDDDYLGTISLKNIDLDNSSAEYAIAVRPFAHGKGIAYEATRIVIEKAFNEYKLHRVYLNVLPSNLRAIKFYEKAGFEFEGEFRDAVVINGLYRNLKWYSIINR